MMKRTLSTLLLAGTLGAQHASASHIVGGEILWECLGNNQYEITLNLFRDCFGITLGTQDFVSFTSPCGTVDLTVNQVSITEVSQLCPEEIVNSTCNGGSLPGIEQWTFTGIVTLPPCDSWLMTWSSCCRNAAVLNIVNPDLIGTQIQGTLNNADFECDNSPVFNNQPIPYVCLGQQVLYSFGVSDQDGDSLNYQFISAIDDLGNPVIYQGGFDMLQPIPGITIDQFSGLMTFTPNQQGNFVVTVMVTEYDDDGNVIGTVMRDIQFVVIPCSNQAPNPSDGAITNLTGSSTQVGPNALEMCETDQFCFDFVISDPDLIDTLTLITNAAVALPGSTFSYSGTNPVSGTICWTATPGSSGFHSFIISASDDACPVNAFQTYVYSVLVLARTNAGPDQTICGQQTAQLEADGGSIFTWSVLSGDPMQVGVNFSCNPCENPIADPNITTTYVVVSDLSGACINSDTVTVNVVPDFTFTATQSDTLICLGEQVNFDVVVNPNVPGYTYEWTPATGLTSTSIPNPTGIYGNPGSYSYELEVTSPDGCVHLDTSLTVVVTPGYVPQFSVTQADSLICEGESTTFNVTLDCSFPSFCGLYDGPCCGPLSTSDIGTDVQTNTTTSYPAPFGNFYGSARHQMLYLASELQAMGFSGGKISELGFNIATVQGDDNYYEWNMRIGCTTVDELATTFWVTGLTDVYYDDTITVVPGWNMFQFPSAFNWDGVSNLVLEVCFNNDPYNGFYTQNSSTYMSTTTFQSVHETRQDQAPDLCEGVDGFVTETFTVRPNTRLVFCGGVDAGDITYTWDPSNGVSDPSSPNPTVTPTSAPTTYTVTVGESGSGCTADAQVTVGWYPPAQVSFVPDPDEGVQPLSVFFENTSAPGSNGYNWVFGNGSTSTDVNPTTLYTEPGWYYVNLTGLSENGCFGSYIDSVHVLDQPIVVIPNVFSPDNDGQNDAFGFVDFRGFASFKMTIFNRWGQEVHSVTAVQSNNAVWRPASEVSDGTYYYEFTGTGSNGDNVVRTGHLTLLRKK